MATSSGSDGSGSPRDRRRSSSSKRKKRHKRRRSKDRSRSSGSKAVGGPKLLVYAASGKAEKLKRALRKGRGDVAYADARGNTALHEVRQAHEL